MKNKQQGFIGIAIIILIAFAAVGSGVYVYNENKIAQNNDPEDTSSIGTTAVPVDVVNEEQLKKAVTEKYAGNSAAVNKVINARAKATFSSFVVKASMKQGTDGSYKNVCADAKSFIEADIQKNMKDGDPLGVSLKSFNTAQIVCKADAGNFIVTMPINLEDGSSAKVCSSPSALGLVGDANYETYTCIKI